MRATLLVYVLGLLFILAMAGFIIQSCENKKLNRESENTKRMIIRSQRQTEKKIDSMVVEQKILEARGRALLLDLETSREELKRRQTEANEWRKKYANIKNTPVPNWSNTDLDSIIWSITR